MFAPRIKLVETLVAGRLIDEVMHIISVARQGFDVHVRTDFPELEKLTFDLLSQQIKKSSEKFRLIRDPSFFSLDEPLPEDNKEKKIMSPRRTILIYSQPLESGYGFVDFLLKSPDGLLGNVASAIGKILDYFGLGLYADVFDASKISCLKQIVRYHGVGSLIDAVMQIAYLSGFHGAEDQAQAYIEKRVRAPVVIDGKKTIPVEKCAERFFSHVVLQGENAHSFLKCSLSYYLVSHQGMTLSKVSRMLSISRTTLHDHLRLADSLGVSKFFQGLQ